MKRSHYIPNSIGVCSLILAGSVTMRAQGVALDWVKQMNSSNANNTMGMAITHDDDGNVYTTGSFSGTVDFDPGPGTASMTAEGLTDIFVTKMDGAGNLIWAKRMGSPTNETEQGVTIAVDGQGNVYTAGVYGGNADMDPGTGTSFLIFSGGWSDAFVSKLDASGNFVWAKSVSGANDENIVSLSLDGSGNLFLAGGFSGTVDFDPGTAVSNMTAANVSGFVAKWDTAGVFVWSRQISGAGSYLTGNLAVAPSGNLYIMGSILDNTVDLDPGAATFNLTPMGFIDAVVLKLNSSGNFVWAKQMGGLFSLGFGIRLALDEQENVINSGVYVGSIDFDPGAGNYDLSSTGSEDIFFQKLDASGNFIWAKTSAGAGASITEIYALTTDVKDNIYATGYLNSGTIDFDPGAATANLTAATSDAFLLKLDSAGNYRWAKQIAGTGTSIGRAITLDASGNVYSTGNFIDTSDFDPGAGVTNLHSNPGKNAIYIQKLKCNDTSSSVVKASGCNSYTFQGQTYTQSDTYQVVMQNEAGCDSTIFLQLDITVFQVAIQVSGNNLAAAAPYTSYKWLMNGNVIPGATQSTYAITQNGIYQLVGTNATGCTDTSDVYNLTFTGIHDVHDMAGQISIYPNPSHDAVFIQAPVRTGFVLTDMAGKVLLQQHDAKRVTVKDLSAGVYFLNITDQNGQHLKTEKLVKQ